MKPIKAIYHDYWMKKIIFFPPPMGWGGGGGGGGGGAWDWGPVDLKMNYVLVIRRLDNLLILSFIKN